MLARAEAKKKERVSQGLNYISLEVHRESDIETLPNEAQRHADQDLSLENAAS